MVILLCKSPFNDTVSSAGLQIAALLVSAQAGARFFLVLSVFVLHLWESRAQAAVSPSLSLVTFLLRFNMRPSSSMIIIVAPISKHDRPTRIIIRTILSSWVVFLHIMTVSVGLEGGRTVEGVAWSSAEVESAVLDVEIVLAGVCRRDVLLELETTDRGR